MKYFLTFIFGAACGAAGALLYLRKGIKSQLEAIENGEDLPFEMKNSENEGGSDQEKVGKSGENGSSVVFQKAPVGVSEADRVHYNKLIDDYTNGNKGREGPPVPVNIRDDDLENVAEEGKNEEDFGQNNNVKDEVLFEIDMDDFQNDHSFEKERYVYFSGDRVMATENGTIITNPYLFVGNQWEQFVGKYAPNTSFIRNTRMNTDYEIFVETGTYTDEYGYDSL